MKLFVLFFAFVLIHSVAGDPSLAALPDSTGVAKYAIRHRILTDLDGDGVGDMLLSGSLAEFGSMGGPWKVLLCRKGKYVVIGEVWAHPMVIAFEPDVGRIDTVLKTRRHARIWVYLKGGGSAGTFGYFRVGEESVDEIKSLEIYPGDGGTVIGNAIYEATFKRSPIPFTIQRSTTGENGGVSWHDF